jgi:hypothetical protein
METKPITTSAAPTAFAEFPSLIRTKACSEKNIFCIIDAAMDDEFYPLLKSSGWEYRCLYKKGVHFKGERMTEALAATAVYLLPIDPDKMPVAQFIGRRLGKHQFIFLQADASIGDLTEHFSGLLKAMDENGNLFNFRYHDPRILRVYLPTCTEEEKHIFYGPAQIFWAEDRDERVLEFPDKIEVQPEIKSLKPDEKKPDRPERAVDISTTPKTPGSLHGDPLTGFGMIGQFSQFDGINDKR